MSRRVGLNISNLEKNIEEAEKKRSQAEKKYLDAKKERLEMEKVAQTFIIYAAVKTAEEKARVEMEKAKKESNNRAETKAKSKIKTASKKITKILKNGKEVADLFFTLASIWANANNGKERKSIEANAKQLAINAKKAEEKARRNAANQARNERAMRQWHRREAERKAEAAANAKKQAESNAKRKAEENAKRQANSNAKKEAEARRRKAEENAKKQAEDRRRKAEENAKKQAEDRRRKQKYDNSNNVYKKAIQELQYIKSRRTDENGKLKQGKKVFLKTVLKLHPNKGGKEELFKKFTNYYNNFETNVKRLKN